MKVKSSRTAPVEPVQDVSPAAMHPNGRPAESSDNLPVPIVQQDPLQLYRAFVDALGERLEQRRQQHRETERLQSDLDQLGTTRTHSSSCSPSKTPDK